MLLFHLEYVWVTSCGSDSWKLFFFSCKRDLLESFLAFNYGTPAGAKGIFCAFLRKVRTSRRNFSLPLLIIREPGLDF